MAVPWAAELSTNIFILSLQLSCGTDRLSEPIFQNPFFTTNCGVE